MNDEEIISDGYLRSNLDMARTLVKDDWDMVFLVDGQERVGKSVIAQQMAYYCDRNFNIDSIAFKPSEFEDKVKTANPYSAIVYDEAYTGLSSRGTMGTVNRLLVELIAEIGQKNLIIFVVMPTYFDLDRYVAIWRSRALVHVFKTDDWKRGRFAFFDFDKKKDMYIDGKKYYNYKHPSPNFHGKFTGRYMVDEAEYKKRKYEALINRKKDKEQHSEDNYRDKFFERLVNCDKLIDKDKWELLGMSRANFYLYLRKYRSKDKIEDDLYEKEPFEV